MRLPRLVALIAGAVALAGCAGSAPTTLQAQSSELVHRSIITDADLAFNPTGEFIFPSVFHAAEHLTDPLGEWYLYYAPHEEPGGIALMYADSLAGPWTEFAGNPVISHRWQPHLDVSHVSSPDAFWNEQDDALYLYFHGENSHTRFATSSDGTSFEYGGVAVQARDVGPDTQEASYARVFDLPSTGEDRFGMFFMAKHTDDTRDIWLATSPDARSWTVAAEPLITAVGDEAPNLSAADLVEWNGALTIVYHASDGAIHGRSISPDLDQIGTPVTLFANADGVRVAAPEYVDVDGRLVLFYERGERLEADIAWASQD